MTCVLEILSIHELMRRKINLLKQLEKIEKELLIRNINLDEYVFNNINDNSNNLDENVFNNINDNLNKLISNSMTYDVSNSIINKDVLNTKKIFINNIEPKIDNIKKIKIKVNIKK